MTIMILHTTNASRRRHFERAREYANRNGHRLVLLQRTPGWEAQLVDRVVDVDTRSLRATVEAAQAVAQSEPIEAVLTFVEHSVPSAAAVAQALGLPGISERTAHLARNKYEMRVALAEHGVPCPGFGLARTAAEACQLARRIGYPVVLKPLIGGGSMWVRRVNDDVELEHHFPALRDGAWEGFEYDPLYAADRAKYGGAVLVEGYVEGAEVSVESVVHRGQTTVVAVHDKPLPMVGPLFEELYFATPSRLPEATLTEVHRLTDAAHRALEISLGATHTEFRITPEGPVILETAARLGGGPVYRSVLSATGIDLVDAVIDVARGRQPDLRPRRSRPTGFSLFFAAREGTVRQIAGQAHALSDPDVVELEIYTRIGDRVGVPPRVFQAHGHAVFTAETAAELDRKAGELREGVTIEVDAEPQAA
jgi:biotin carboxylase